MKLFVLGLLLAVLKFLAALWLLERFGRRPLDRLLARIKTGSWQTL